jgi:hypothetical protein
MTRLTQRRLRRRAIGWVLAPIICGTIVSAALAAGSADARGRACAAAASRTIVASRDARAYRLRGRTFACRYRTNRRFWLQDEPADPDYFRAESIRLAGPYVGYELAFIGRSSFFRVQVRDLRNGRWLRRLPAMTPGSDQNHSGVKPGVSDLELARNGAVAWIARNPYVDPPTVEVHKADADGHAQLDAGAGIDPGSLALSGKRIYWLKDGQPITATLR